MGEKKEMSTLYIRRNNNGAWEELPKKEIKYIINDIELTKELSMRDMYPSIIDEVTFVGGLVKSNYISCSPRQITPRKVIFSGLKTIVIWEDRTKTIVGCAEGQEYDEYAGFCAALAKKIFGTTSKAKRMMENRR